MLAGHIRTLGCAWSPERTVQMPTEASLGTTQGGWNAGSFGAVPFTLFEGPLHPRDHYTIVENLPASDDIEGVSVIESGGAASAR